MLAVRAYTPGPYIIFIYHHIDNHFLTIAAVCEGA